MAKRAAKAAGHVALLRGINVGGKHMVPMASLVEMFERAGCEGVRTYIQSGNVLFSAEPTRAVAAAKQVAGAIEERFGFAAPIVVRTAQELDGVIAENPIHGPGAAVPEGDHKLLHVGFLSARPGAERVKMLDPGRSPRDRFAVRGSEVYVHYAGGVAGSRLTTAYFDSTLKAVCTFRNWRTVVTLAGMLRGVA